MTEIEAKFMIPDRATFDRFCQLQELADFLLEPAGIKRIRDRYLDTEDRAILQAGYACRLRSKDVSSAAAGRGAYLATLKGLGGADATSGIHQREELEVWVDGPNPLSWPESRVRDLVLSYGGGKLLIELFSLSQERHLRLLHRASPRDNPPLAELSLDLVVPGGNESEAYYELEIELLNEDEIAGLKLIAAYLHSSWGLKPEARSKFERGLGPLVV